jgi:hypothetical protein
MVLPAVSRMQVRLQHLSPAFLGSVLKRLSVIELQHC